AAPQHGRADVDQAVLLLRVNPYVVAMYVSRSLFRFGRIERKTNLALQLFEESFRGPTLLQKQKFEPRFFPALPQRLARSKDFRDAARYGHNLFPLDKRVQPQGNMRICRKPAANPQRKSR